jgi:hypothetical protein
MINPRAQQYGLAASGGRQQLRDTRRSRETVVELETRDDKIVGLAVGPVEDCHVRRRDVP